MGSELKYHQAAFDMLTSRVIDPQSYLVQLDKNEAQDREYTQQNIHKLRLSEVIQSLQSLEYKRIWTTIPLYGAQPELSSSKVQLLDTFERKFQKQLPASFREWYSLTIGLSLLYVDDAWLPHTIEALDAMYTGYQEMLPQQITEEQRPDSYDDIAQLFFEHDRFVFIGEQQADNYCIRLNEGDDPPVYHLNVYRNRECNTEQSQLTITLRQRAPHFSDFVYCFLWEWLAYYTSAHGFALMTSSFADLQRNPAFSVSRIQTQFQEIKQQWRSQHRFYSKTQRIFFPMKGHYGWFKAFADDETALRDLIHALWMDRPPIYGMVAFKEQTEAIIESLKSS